MKKATLGLAVLASALLVSTATFAESYTGTANDPIGNNYGNGYYNSYPAQSYPCQGYSSVGGTVGNPTGTYDNCYYAPGDGYYNGGDNSNSEGYSANHR